MEEKKYKIEDSERNRTIGNYTRGNGLTPRKDEQIISIFSTTIPRDREKINIEIYHVENATLKIIERRYPPYSLDPTEATLTLTARKQEEIDKAVQTIEKKMRIKLK